jgi:hypothetical protein
MFIVFPDMDKALEESTGTQYYRPCAVLLAASGDYLL